MQIVQWLNETSLTPLSLPDPHEQILPGVPWGRAEEVFSSAYWGAVARMIQPNPNTFRLGQTLREEVAACLLGGYGITAEFGLAAFARLKSLNLLAPEEVSEPKILDALLAPLTTRHGKTGHYRFARQKARYLAKALRTLDVEYPPEDSGKVLRDWLKQLPGIGWKTASWIARNWLGAEDVAILDIHIMRAGVLAGIFERSTWHDMEYRKLEERFLAWARALTISPAHLDALIWQEMRSCTRFAAAAIKQSDILRGQCPRPQTIPLPPRPTGVPRVRRSGQGFGKTTPAPPQ